MSHWFLDALVHAPELRVAGESSMRLGLGLLEHLTIALLAETAIVLAGLHLLIPNSGLARLKAALLTASSLLLLGCTIAGMTIAPPPPSATAMAWGSLLRLIVVCALVLWVGRQPGRARA